MRLVKSKCGHSIAVVVAAFGEHHCDVLYGASSGFRAKSAACDKHKSLSQQITPIRSVFRRRVDGAILPQGKLVSVASKSHEHRIWADNERQIVLNQKLVGVEAAGLSISRQPHDVS
jgi:hypothetical protein